MGFRFRKSVKAGPLRVNISKSGVGYSIGGKGLRYTKKAKGGTRTTTSIPGTGISYVKDSKQKRREKTVKYHGKFETTAHSQSANKGSRKPDGAQGVTLAEVLLAWLLGGFGGHKFYRKKIGLGICYFFTLGLCFVGWFGDAIWLTIQYASAKQGSSVTKVHKFGSYAATALCVVILGGCGGGGSAPTPTKPIETEAIAISTTATEAEALETAAPTAAPETTSPATEAPTFAPTTVPTTEPETEPATEPEQTAVPTTMPTEPKEEMVWIPTNGGTKYHRSPSCSSMSNPDYVTISHATERGFTPCKRCY